MLLIETFIKSSAIHGIGLFASNNYKRGQEYWKRDSSFDIIFTPNEVSLFPTITQLYIQMYGFLEPNSNWYVCIDNARFTNHSLTPNTKFYLDNQSFVLRGELISDIYIGDEITCNYNEICEYYRAGNEDY